MKWMPFSSLGERDFSPFEYYMQKQQQPGNSGFNIIIINNNKSKCAHPNEPGEYTYGAWGMGRSANTNR